MDPRVDRRSHARLPPFLWKGSVDTQNGRMHKSLFYHCTLLHASLHALLHALLHARLHALRKIMFYFVILHALLHNAQSIRQQSIRQLHAHQTAAWTTHRVGMLTYATLQIAVTKLRLTQQVL